MEKNPVEPEKNDKFPKKTYTFDITKCDEIFDLLVKDGQMIVPLGAKMPPLEQREVFANITISWVIKLLNVFFSGILFKVQSKKEGSNLVRSPKLR